MRKTNRLNRGLLPALATTLLGSVMLLGCGGSDPQVVRTTARGGVPGAAPAIAATNVPAIAVTPAAGDTIGFVGNSITIPQ